MGTASELAPSSGPVAGRVEVAEAVLGEVERRYQAGRYLDAYRAALESGPLAAWRGIDARILAGRLAGRLGGTRLSRLLIATAFRERPRHAGAVLYRAYDLLSLRGPLAVWEFTAGWDALEGLTAAAAGGLLALRARLAGLFRDFELADRLMVQALERCPESPCVPRNVSRMRSGPADAAWSSPPGSAPRCRNGPPCSCAGCATGRPRPGWSRPAPRCKAAR
jgi:hypothetical protein